MLFGPQKGSPFTIFDNFAGTFGVPITVVILAAVFQNMSALLENGIVLMIVVISPLYRLLTYFFTHYSVDEDTFHVKSGIFNKKELEIPLDRITTVDFTQNLIFQWAGVYSIKVDNASSYGGNGVGKVSLALKKNDAVRFKALLLSKKALKEKQEETFSQIYRGKDYCAKIPVSENNVYDAQLDRIEKSRKAVPAKNILIMGALQSKGNAVAQVISIAAVLAGMVNIIAGRDIGIEDTIMDLILSVSGIGIAGALILIFIILSTALGALFNLIKYYGFSITNGEKSIYLEYGLFTKKNYSLLKEKISGAEFVQSLPMKFFGVGYLNVLAVGYGDVESVEKAMIYPLISERKLYEFISEYIPEIKPPENKYEKPYRRSLRYFFICPRFIFLIMVFISAVLCEMKFGFIKNNLWFDWIWYVFILLFILSLLSVIAEYKNTKISCDKNNVHFVTGGFTRTLTVVKTDMIESVSDKAHRLKRTKGIVTIHMGIMAPEMDSSKRIRNMHLDAVESIKRVIHY